MRSRLLTLAASALILSGGLALAQQTTPETAPQQQGQGMGQMGQGMGPGMMGQRMGRGKMGHRMGHRMGHAMHRGPHMRIMFILMDADGNGTLSLEEVQSAHARIFNYVDADDDNQVSFEELQAFFRGGPQGMEARGDDDTEDTAE